MLLMFGLCLSGLIQFLNFIYVDTYNYNWSRIMMHHFYEEEENIDNVFIGSSHVYYNIDPEILNELNGKKNFNLGTSNQTLDGSYYMLREALRYHELEHVYLEVYYSLSTVPKAGANIIWWTSEYMENSRNRMEYIYNVVPAGQYLETILPFLRYKNKMFDLEYIHDVIEYKTQEDYIKYYYSATLGRDEVIEYRQDGYCYNTVVMKQDDLWVRETAKLKEEPMLEEYKEYLIKIIELCKEEGIGLTVYSAPMYELKLLCVENYDAYISQLNEITEQYGIEYYDFNLVKSEVLPIQDRECFFDLDHLNATGVERYTQFLHEVMQNTKEENKKYFYSSYAEKLAKEEGRVYGLSYVEDEDSQTEKWEVVSSRPNSMEYRILVTPEYGETKMLQDFLEEPYILVPKDGDGIYTIVSRCVGEPNSVSTFEVDY